MQWILCQNGSVRGMRATAWHLRLIYLVWVGTQGNACARGRARDIVFPWSLTCDCPDKCVIKGKCISLRKILCKCDVIRLESVTFNEDLRSNNTDEKYSSEQHQFCDLRCSPEITDGIDGDCRDALKKFPFPRQKLALLWETKCARAFPLLLE